MAETKTRPGRPSRPTSGTATTDPATTIGETPKEAPKRRGGRRPKPREMRVYVEDEETTTLTGVGEWPGEDAAGAITAYVEALEDDDRASVLETGTFAVETAEGLVRLRAAQKLVFEPR